MKTLLRILLGAIAVYLVSFIFFALASYVMGIPVDTPAHKWPFYFWGILITGNAMIYGLFAWWYFKDPLVEASLKEGIKIGAFWILITGVVEFLFLFFLPEKVPNPGSGYVIAYASFVYYWLLLVAILFATTVAARLEEW